MTRPIEIVIDVVDRRVAVPAYRPRRTVRPLPTSTTIVPPQGLDDIGLTLRHVDEIDAFEATRPVYSRVLRRRPDARWRPSRSSTEASTARWCWERLTPYLVERGHDAVAMDLPSDDPDATLSDYVTVVVDVLAQVDGPVVLVGHSMAGMVVPYVPKLLAVSRVVLVCPMVHLAW